jgi:hypothetical protein
MKLEDLLTERERLAAYGLHLSLALIDAEIERLSTRKEKAAPVERQAPARTTAAAKGPAK